ncbi:MAG: methylenetetrahydrofolate--tRNA-(uracil(54)-C(5))-methyltransferase (FADH(2)-oxidizing) TrmFO [Deltaproteobacteria bacterium]
MSDKIITVVGGGLAGVEAAHQITKFGLRARLIEMRPAIRTEAHGSANFAELVCSNSLKSDSTDNAAGVLKREMRHLGSIVLEAADATRVPAGKALAVDREKFSALLTRKTEQNPLVEVQRAEFTKIPDLPDSPVVIATGPLTSKALSDEIARITGSSHLYFYDAISPIIDAETIDIDAAFRASRYEEGDEAGGDYLNCPMNREEYYQFIDALIGAEKIEARDFEKALYFESCLPIEVMAERGRDTLRFGPMKPVGIINPRTGKMPFAVVQLRMENREGSMYNMVGFQTKLKYPEQRRIFGMIPGLQKAEFMRHGSIHRNTFINSPTLLLPTLELRGRRGIFFAGQITGVEGYTESAAMGIIAGINAARVLLGREPITPPGDTALGSLIRYITDGSVKNFQPMNINFGLFPPPPQGARKSDRKKSIAERALASIDDFAAFRD